MNQPRFRISGTRLLYAYSLDDGLHRGLLKLAERIFRLSDDEERLAAEDPMLFADLVRPHLPAGARLERMWLGRYESPIGAVAVCARQIYDILEGAGVEARPMREQGRDLWFAADTARLDEAFLQAREQSWKREQARRDKELEILNPKKRKRKASASASASASGPAPSRPQAPIRFRPEQEEAIQRTIGHFAKDVNPDPDYKPRFLWNAKMRFGKTLSALEVAKRRGYKSVLIITHRPVVDDGWHEDFEKIFFDRPNYKYGSRNFRDDDNIADFQELTRQALLPDGGFVFFVSMQYLRLSQLVGGKDKKGNRDKEAILDYPWELVVIDEAHEGTKSEQGSNVMKYLWLDTPETMAQTAEEARQAKRSKRNGLRKLPHTLSLSGTPFNLYGDFSASEIFTWDYVAEQEAKERWNELNGDDPNPYDVLPRMHIFNHDVERITGKLPSPPGAGPEPGNGSGSGYGEADLDESQAGFSFSRFFQVWTGRPKTDGAPLPSPEHVGRFMHDEQVKKFFHHLALSTDEGSNYPFSTDEFRQAFRHTFWMLPHVAEARALKQLLEEEDWVVDGREVRNPYFDQFRVLNVAGSGDEDQDSEALRQVRRGILEAQHDNKYTITLSCGKLTTGVSVPEWTAVFYLKGNDDTRAAAYLQTIFRVQTPAVIDGRQKTDAYVFDFSPTRSLRVFAEAVKLNVATRSGRSPYDPSDPAAEQAQADKWLKFMPIQPLVPGVDGRMRPYDAKTLFDELNRHLTDRAVRSGYADNSIYDPVAIMALDQQQRDTLVNLGKLINAAGNQREVPAVVTNPPKPNPGAPRPEPDPDPGKPKRPKTEEERKREEWNREKRSRMAILRAMSVRIPLLMYGAEVDDENMQLDIENFTALFRRDRASWDEFMPPGVTPEIFDALRSCYNPSVFRAAAKQIRDYAREADRCDVEERIRKIADIFSFFRNPDKETVLTPWRVVNLHLSETLGGWTFFNDTFAERGRLSDPRHVARPGVTERVFDAPDLPALESMRILELNSKTGLYPLYVTYSLYRARKRFYKIANLLDRTRVIPDDRHIWDETLRENVFVVCKTGMARKITRRTLVGFRTNPDGSPIAVNAIHPTWKLTERELVRKNVLKKSQLKEYNPDRKHPSDLVTVLRVSPDLFERDVQSRLWWERQLKHKLEKQSTDMIRFNAVVGNPPYQEVNDGNGTGANPLYHLFIDAGRMISTISTMIHPARFLFKAGKTPKDWNEAILNDPHFKVARYWVKSYEVFDNVDVKGGIAITLSDKTQNCGPIGVFSPYSNLESILSKVLTPEFESFSELVSPREAYGLTEELYKENPQFESRPSKGHRYSLSSNVDITFPEILFDEQSETEERIQIYGRYGNQRGVKWIKRSYISLYDSFEHYKVFVPKANGTGAIGEVLSTPVIGVPVIGHTDTFLSIGKFANAEEASACLKYVKSKFARCMLGTLKATQINPKHTWANVPLQDFTEASDIDWTQSVADIDRQLYRKYGLEQSEIDFIERMIKPME